MQDKRLEERKQFFDPVKDGRIEREKYMVELRKKHKQKLFHNKRMIRMQEESKGQGPGAYYENGTMTIISRNEDYPLYKYQKYLQPILPILYEDGVLLVSPV